jgi:hypothetical protein
VFFADGAGPLLDLDADRSREAVRCELRVIAISYCGTHGVHILGDQARLGGHQRAISTET